MLIIFIYFKRINDIKEFFLNREILICREISKYHEEYIRVSVNELSKINFSRKGEITVVISEAKKEISHYTEYDFVIVNNDLQLAVDQIKLILFSERLRRYRQLNLNKTLIRNTLR